MGGRRWIAALAVAAAIGFGACGDDGSTNAASPEDDEATTTTTAEGQAQTTAAPDPTEAITALYLAFFDGTNTDQESKLALLESPEDMRDIFTRAFSDPAFAGLISQVQGDVVTVTPTSDTTAELDYRLLLDGQPATEGNFLGRAVLVGDEWRIADSTFCTVVGLGNPAYAQEPVCIDAING